jgi:hypothetical protein
MEMGEDVPHGSTDILPPYCTLTINSALLVILISLSPLKKKRKFERKKLLLK